MTNFEYKKIGVLLSFLLIVLVACSTPSPQGNAEEDTAIANVQAEYVQFSRDEMMRSADMIFVGKVLSITPTKWNQDSGEYWEAITEEGVNEQGESLTTTHSGWPIHEIELVVAQSLINDSEAIEKSIVLTVLGKSPVDQEPPGNDTEVVTVVGEAPYSLQVGDEVVIFAVYTEIAWRDPDQPIRLVPAGDGTSYFDIGKRAIIGFISSPADSYLIKGEDGLYHSSSESNEVAVPVTLEDLRKQIAEQQRLRQ